VPVSGVVTIIAASVAAPTKTATAIVTIKIPTNVQITFTGPPLPTTLLTSQQAQVAANVENDATNAGPLDLPAGLLVRLL
jgi:hypothetical protein